MGRLKSAKLEKSDFEKPLYLQNLTNIKNRLEVVHPQSNLILSEQSLAEILYQLQSYSEVKKRITIK
jgi:hypothetical protein